MLDQHRPDNQIDLAFILIPLYQDTTKAIECQEGVTSTE